MNVLIAGGGPAGSHLGRILAENGIDVALVERLNDPYKQAFSSAALPIDALNSHSIPPQSISAYWKNWQIYSPSGRSFIWEANNNLGVVLDFGELRNQLWKTARSAGVKLLLGWKVEGVESFNSFAKVKIISSDGLVQHIKANVVIDATGYKRSLIGTSYKKNDQLLIGNGIEWVIQSEDSNYAIWEKKLSFFLGSGWVKHGYGWIFPMAMNRLKVGICRLPPDNQIISNNDELKSLLKRFKLNKSPVINKHGGLIRSTLKRTDLHVSERIIGVGDTVSTTNLLGGEGIRHALTSAEILSKVLIKFISETENNDLNDFLKLRDYQKVLNNCLGWQWNLSNRIAKKTWWNLSDEEGDSQINKILCGLYKKSTAEDLSSILFDYKFERYGFRLLPYLFGFK